MLVDPSLFPPFVGLQITSHTLGKGETLNTRFKPFDGQLPQRSLNLLNTSLPLVNFLRRRFPVPFSPSFNFLEKLCDDLPCKRRSRRIPQLTTPSLNPRHPFPLHIHI